MAGPTILLSAGEPSGDLHGAEVARELRLRWPDARLYGLGGPRMAEAGVELLADVDRLALVGFVEVAGRLPYLLRVMRRLRREMVRRATDLVLPIDYPGFNLRLARQAKQAGVPVLYYIAPQVWAWHAGRARTLARCVNRLAVVLPFEEALFREAGARATFVGHPLLDTSSAIRSREAFCRTLGLDPERPILALFPGSRTQELDRHLDVFTAAAELVARREPAVQPVIAASDGVPDGAYRDVRIACTAASRELLHHARAALMKSGTGTLEAALAGVPMVIAYRLHPLTFWLARRLVRVEHVGLANLVAGERVVPELLQGEATPAALADAVVPLLDAEGAERAAMVDSLARVRSRLSAPGNGRSAAARVADLAGTVLERDS